VGVVVEGGATEGGGALGAGAGDDMLRPGLTDVKALVVTFAAMQNS
jgi:hypothetical protein